MSRFQTLIAVGLAIVPLGLYLVGIGCLHLRRRPSLLQGSLDFALLAAGVAGLVLVAQGVARGRRGSRGLQVATAQPVEPEAEEPHP